MPLAAFLTSVMDCAAATAMPAATNRANLPHLTTLPELTTLAYEIPTIVNYHTQTFASFRGLHAN